MIAGQIQDAEDWPEGWKTFNRRYMYAALNWCTESHSAIIDTLRELCGGGIFQMPADITVMHDPKLKAQFETYWQTPQLPALRAHEALQARLGPDRLGVRRPPPAVREVLRRRVLHRAQPQLARSALGRITTRWSTT